MPCVERGHTAAWKWVVIKLSLLRISNFQSFGPEPTAINLERLTYILGPNGSGKTAVLQAMARMFGVDQTLRRVQESDFHCVTGSEILEEGADLWIEAEFEFPEAADAMESHSTIPPFFAHMQLETDDETPRIRMRLTAILDVDGTIEESMQYILSADDGVPTNTADVSLYDRRAIQLHYLPARRDPSDQISYAATSILGRALRAANWTAEREKISGLTEQITTTLASNTAISSIGLRLGTSWSTLHSGSYFNTPSITFGRSEVENLLRHMTVTFLPSPDGKPIDYERLSDGQKSLLYISIVLALQSIGRDALAGKSTAFDVDKLRPAIFTIVAIEEPENSLSPQYLGRVVKALRVASEGSDCQALIATHSPALLRRVPPEHIRFLRLNSERETTVRSILLPAAHKEAHKFVREAVQAFPELYFSRLVILGEGDSEEIVIPRFLSAVGIADDDLSISVVPLGGRHVNHFWRLLHGLDIPHVTLLDLDLARYGGGWGRISYAVKQLKKCASELSVEGGLTDSLISKLPAWDSTDIIPAADNKSWLGFLERHGVFYSAPIDLDFMLLEAYPGAYGIGDPGKRDLPTAATVSAVLGKSHSDEGRLGDSRLRLFDDYHSLFKLSSKPATHLDALANLDDEQLLAAMPASLARLIEEVRKRLAEIPE